MAHEVIEARRPPSVKLLEQLKRLTDFCKPAEGANATWRARTNESRLRSCESNVNICYKLAKQVQQEMELATQCAELVVPLGPCLLIQLPSTRRCRARSAAAQTSPPSRRIRRHGPPSECYRDAPARWAPTVSAAVGRRGGRRGRLVRSGGPWRMDPWRQACRGRRPAEFRCGFRNARVDIASRPTSPVPTPWSWTSEFV